MEATTRQSAQVSPQIATPFSDHPSLWGAVRRYYAGGFLSCSADKWISGDPWDPKKAFIRGGLTAVEGMVAFGAGGVASLVSWEGGKIIRIGKKLINVQEPIAQNFVSDVFGNPSGWLLDLIMDYFYG